MPNYNKVNFLTSKGNLRYPLTPIDTQYDKHTQSNVPTQPTQRHDWYNTCKVNSLRLQSAEVNYPPLQFFSVSSF